jgi:hypothetical protein
LKKQNKIPSPPQKTQENENKNKIIKQRKMCFVKKDLGRT